ncbi:thiamine-phosphate kinase [Thiosulfativibrio zosterae]|uniref:Thiamine-monophosphate kinase n=1 Tax=Thiosulfativibrio zosterae TaxID=2675053 RepID=A0A6F8PMF1_9GAMM|nr:thiamine-phosphate kinase [Thiosulfativibrio zosterae]BBP43282.1 thiamine-monophosphate kinase [Thiosulfativibrio zosterae]
MIGLTPFRSGFAMSHEFDLINQYFAPLSQVDSGEVGIGDDGAILNCPANHQLVVVTDTLIAGRHFPLNTTPYDIAWKALAVNLSDLAAMGAKPAFYSLALTLSPQENNQAWLKSFSLGLKTLSEQAQIRLIGGDTTQGPLSITVTAQGWVPSGKGLLRSGALAYADIYISGALGNGGLGLANVLNQLMPGDVGYCTDAIAKLNRPEPRLSLGQALLAQNLALAAIDISDGFLADLSHILKASNLAASIDYDALPLSEALIAWAKKQSDSLFGLNTGDDYELCFVALPDSASAIKQLADSLGLRLSRVGQTLPYTAEGERLVLRDSAGNVMPMKRLGYQHF